MYVVSSSTMDSANDIYFSNVLNAISCTIAGFCLVDTVALFNAKFARGPYIYCALAAFLSALFNMMSEIPSLSTPTVGKILQFCLIISVVAYLLIMFCTVERNNIFLRTYNNLYYINALISIIIIADTISMIILICEVIYHDGWDDIMTFFRDPAFGKWTEPMVATTVITKSIAVTTNELVIMFSVYKMGYTKNVDIKFIGRYARLIFAVTPQIFQVVIGAIGANAHMLGASRGLNLSIGTYVMVDLFRFEVESIKNNKTLSSIPSVDPS